ncbi:MAG: hypothetical protein ABII26_02280 [Pseudomonadota bacterium]
MSPRVLCLVSFLVLSLLWGCAAPVQVIKEPPVRLEGFMSSKWGASPEEVKKAVEQDGIKWFQDHTGETPYTLYASGTYLDHSAIFSYFFTPKTKKLYRVDVTFNDLRAYEKGKGHLFQTFKTPSFSQKDLDHWSWLDRSLLILQKDQTHVQISFSNGDLLLLNQKEREGTSR